MPGEDVEEVRDRICATRDLDLTLGQRNVVAERGLGLRREPPPDRGVPSSSLVSDAASPAAGDRRP